MEWIKITNHSHGCPCCGKYYTRKVSLYEQGTLGSFDSCRCVSGPFDTLCIGCYERKYSCCASRPDPRAKRSGSKRETDEEATTL